MLPRIVIVTGIMGAGKSTVAQALAERLPRSVHLRGDVFRRMIVGGRAPQGPEATDEDATQLALRYDLAADAAERYARADFTVIWQDILFGPDLRRTVERLAVWRPGAVVLAPRAEVAAARDRARAKTAYGEWSAAAFDDAFRRDTHGIGLWIDNSELSVEETVDRILAGGEALRRGCPG